MFCPVSSCPWCQVLPVCIAAPELNVLPFLQYNTEGVCVCVFYFSRSAVSLRGQNEKESEFDRDFFKYLTFGI